MTNYVNDVNIVNTVAFSVERLSTAFFNARSIVNKFDEFEVFVHNKEPDIIDVSETWLCDSVGSIRMIERNPFRHRRFYCD